jgi:uncharacterized membrane protein
MADPLLIATAVAALGGGLVAGVFFAFSSFVMPALRALPTAEGIRAMQSINIAAVTPVFMTALFGTALVALGCGVAAGLDTGAAYSPYLFVAAVLYLAGPVSITLAYHVPRNDALAAVDPGGRGADTFWRAYLRQWTNLNHLRGALALAAAAAQIGAIHVG